MAWRLSVELLTPGGAGPNPFFLEGEWATEEEARLEANKLYEQGEGWISVFQGRVWEPDAAGNYIHGSKDVVSVTTVEV